MGKPGQLDYSFFYLEAGTLGAVGCDCDIDVRAQIMKDLPQRRYAPFPVGSPDGPYPEKCYDSRYELTITMTAYQDLSAAAFFCKWHHEQAAVPEADDKIEVFAPFFMGRPVDMGYAQGGT